MKNNEIERTRCMKKVLIVAYAFPPVGGAGVQRPTKFVKYLRNYGWEPSVLTCLNPSVPVTDEALLGDIPPGIEIFYARTFEPGYASKVSFAQNKNVDENTLSVVGKIKNAIKAIAGLFLVPDVQVLWWPGLVCKLIWLLNKRSFDCVFVTAPPFSSMIPVALVCRLFGVPVIADFRDEWVFNRIHIENSSKNSFVNWIDKQGEKLVVHSSAAIVAATSRYIQSLQERHPAVNQAKMYSITNGFDADDFLGRSSLIPKVKADGRRINIVYTGTVWSATSLEKFLVALGFLFIEHPAFKEIVHLKVYGRIVPSEAHYLTSSTVTENIELKGYCSHNTILQEIMAADILLLTLSNYDGAERIIPAKTFEYMVTGNPILALLPEGEAKEVLVASGVQCGFAHPDEANNIKTALLRILNALDTEKTQSESNHKTNIQQFSRYELTGSLVSVLSKYSK